MSKPDICLGCASLGKALGRAEGHLDDCMAHTRRLNGELRGLRDLAESRVRLLMKAHLTPDEKAVLARLKDAIGQSIRLPAAHPSEPRDFADRAPVFGSHRLQDLVAARVARRLEPDHWWQPEEAPT